MFAYYTHTHVCRSSSVVCQEFLAVYSLRTTRCRCRLAAHKGSIQSCEAWEGAMLSAGGSNQDGWGEDLSDGNVEKGRIWE